MEVGRKFWPVRWCHWLQWRRVKEWTSYRNGRLLFLLIAHRCKYIRLNILFFQRTLRCAYCLAKCGTFLWKMQKLSNGQNLDTLELTRGRQPFWIGSIASRRVLRLPCDAWRKLHPQRRFISYCELEIGRACFMSNSTSQRDLESDSPNALPGPLPNCCHRTQQRASYICQLSYLDK